MTPLPHFGHTVLTKAVEDVARLLAQVALHEQVGANIASYGSIVLFSRMLSPIATPVVFQVIDAPAVITLSILQFVVDTSQVTSAGAITWRGVNAKLEAFAMKPVAQILHAWELLIHSDGSIGITFRCLPSVVDVHIGIAVVSQPLLNQSLGARDNLVLSDT